MSDLKRGGIADLIDRMQAMVKKASGDRQKAMAGELAYFIKGQQQQRLNYSKIAAMKLPIGSGAVESLIRGCGKLSAQRYWKVLAAQTSGNDVARPMPVGSRNLGKFL